MEKLPAYLGCSYGGCLVKGDNFSIRLLEKEQQDRATQPYERKSIRSMVIHYEILNSKNFNTHSLNHFVRHQQVKECWRNVDGQWKLVPIEFEENWSIEQCQKIAADVALHMEKDQTAIGVFDGEEVIGFITVSHNIFGNTAKYVELVCFQVSEPYRGMGIGKALFYHACEEARRLGADKLYISAHSSKESQAAYKALGCVHAKEINQKLAEEEPCDVQLEYVLD